MNKNFLAGISTLLIISSMPAAAHAQQIACYKQGDVIQCPGYGDFNYRNSGNNSNNSNQTQIESSIRDIYLQVLGRNADANGLRTYTNSVSTRRLSLVQVRYQLVNSAEAEQSIRRIYRQANRNLNANQLRNTKISMQNGSTLEQLRQELGLNDNSNTSNTSNYGDQRATIVQIYQQVLGRDPDNGGLGSYSDAVQNGRLSFMQVRRELAYSSESDQNINKIYQQILGRNVNSNELSNSRRILESNNGSLDQVQSQLANSNEARTRNGDRTFSLGDLLGIFK
jgi:hypothetical protein